jgi:hypothetical protein
VCIFASSLLELKAGRDINEVQISEIWHFITPKTKNMGSGEPSRKIVNISFRLCWYLNKAATTTKEALLTIF